VSGTCSAHGDLRRDNLEDRRRWEDIIKCDEQGFMISGKVLRPRGHCNINVTKLIIIEINDTVHQFKEYN
jgi:hypothetical protein